MLLRAFTFPLSLPIMNWNTINCSFKDTSCLMTKRKNKTLPCPALDLPHLEPGYVDDIRNRLKMNRAKTLLSIVKRFNPPTKAENGML